MYLAIRLVHAVPQSTFIKVLPARLISFTFRLTLKALRHSITKSRFNSLAPQIGLCCVECLNTYKVVLDSDVQITLSLFNRLKLAVKYTWLV